MDSAEDTPRDEMTIELNLPVFEKIARAHGWGSNAEIAEAIGVSERQVRRVRNGTGRPGIEFIAGLLNAVEEAGFRRTFRVVPKSASIRKD